MTPGEAKKKYPLFARFCKLCGCPLAIGITYDGKEIPLDLRSPVYTHVYDREQRHAITVVHNQLCFVNHSYSCPQWDPKTKAVRQTPSAPLANTEDSP